MWEEKIEKLYQIWIKDNELFGAYGEKKFLRFVWACIQDEKNAPQPYELLDRIKSDFSEHEEGCKNKIAGKAEGLYITLKDYEEVRKEN